MAARSLPDVLADIDWRHGPRKLSTYSGSPRINNGTALGGGCKAVSFCYGSSVTITVFHAGIPQSALWRRF